MERRGQPAVDGERAQQPDAAIQQHRDQQGHRQAWQHEPEGSGSVICQHF